MGKWRGHVSVRVPRSAVAPLPLPLVAPQPIRVHPARNGRRWALGAPRPGCLLTRTPTEPLTFANATIMTGPRSETVRGRRESMATMITSNEARGDARCSVWWARQAVAAAPWLLLLLLLLWWWGQWGHRLLRELQGPPCTPKSA